jgi:hypothetical protein
VSSYIAYAFVENFHSSSNELSLGEFTLRKIVQGDFEKLNWAKKVFASESLQFDWIYERVYDWAPKDARANFGFGDLSGFGGIPFLIEDDLLLPRLLRHGDIVFQPRRHQETHWRVFATGPISGNGCLPI